MTTILLHNAKDPLESQTETKLSKEMVVHKLVYADDTLLIDVDCQAFEVFMNCIADVKNECGLSFN